LLLCAAVWFGVFLSLSFCLNDLPLICLIVFAVIHYIIDAPPWPATAAITLLFGAALGKGARFALRQQDDVKWQKRKDRELDQKAFLAGLVVLLAFSSWWRLKMFSVYRGPRWMGLWDDPNTYGTLMGVGILLASGLIATSLKPRVHDSKSEFKIQSLLKPPHSFAAINAILLTAIFMMTVGLVMSYSRGAWLGTAIGVLYLANAHKKFNLGFVLPVIFIVTIVVYLFWNATPDSSSWYVKRMDFGRPSAQHRVAAWKAGLEMMQDHPFGVGWNKTVETYQQHYSPPEYGAAAICTNDYLMLGTQLGIPALICFVAYVTLCFRNPKSDVRDLNLQTPGEHAYPITLDRILHSTQVTCRAATLAMLVEFWFDGGLFKLPTASTFWILLEMGIVRQNRRWIR
jgi:O-antigen ligase